MRNVSFDEQPCTEINSEDIDFRAASEFFSAVSRKLTPAVRKTLGRLLDGKIWDQMPGIEIPMPDLAPA